jgi:predicted acyl esterase
MVMFNERMLCYHCQSIILKELIVGGRLKYMCTGLIFFLISINLCAQNAIAINHKNGIKIYSHDGTLISANVYMPSNEETQGRKWPLVIMPNSWDLNEYEYTIPAKKLAKKGYIVLSYSARGWGKSGGQVNAAGPQDIEDINAIISWALEQLPSDPNNIAMLGISYGGGLSLLAAGQDSRIKAVAVMSAWSDLENALYGNKSPSMLWGKLLVNTGKLFGRLNPEINTNYKNLLKHEHVNQAKNWAKLRSPKTYIDGLNRNQTAVYFSQNLGDQLFKANMILNLYQQLKTAKHLDLNQGIHGTAEAPGLFGLDNYIWRQAFKWLDHWLKGNNNRIENSPALSVELKGGKRLRFTQWPLSIQNQHYQLQKGSFLTPGKLTKENNVPAGSDKLSFSLVTGVNSGLPIISSILDSYKELPIITWLPGINRFSAVYYVTNKLTKKKTIIGIPKVKLWYKPSSQKSQLIAYLYDVDGFGMGRLISHAPISHYHDIPGSFVDTEFELAMTAYVIPKGHRIALALGMFDVLYQAPSFAPYTIKIAYGNQMASSIEIPFID